MQTLCTWHYTYWRSEAGKHNSVTVVWICFKEFKPLQIHSNILVHGSFPVTRKNVLSTWSHSGSGLLSHPPLTFLLPAHFKAHRRFTSHLQYWRAFVTAASAHCGCRGLYAVFRYAAERLHNQTTHLTGSWRSIPPSLFSIHLYFFVRILFPVFTSFMPSVCSFEWPRYKRLNIQMYVPHPSDCYPCHVFLLFFLYQTICFGDLGQYMWWEKLH